MFYLDPLYMLGAVPILLLSLGITIFLKVVYSNYSNKINSKGFNGLDTVSKIAEKYNFNINVEQGYDYLSDNYNPLNRTVSLSADVAKKVSVASVGIAAHEMGHVAQHQSGFILTTIRTAIAPIVTIGSNLAYILFILGFALGILNLVWVGVFLFSGTTLFTIITLPIELDASRRAVNMIKELDLVDIDNRNGVRIVLFAASLTYVAAVVQSMWNLLYYIIRARQSSRD